MCIFFFFFQAEDGIRDLTVTGVQTCALPICHPMAVGTDHDVGDRVRTPPRGGVPPPADQRRAGVHVTDKARHPATADRLARLFEIPDIAIIPDRRSGSLLEPPERALAAAVVRPERADEAFPVRALLGDVEDRAVRAGHVYTVGVGRFVLAQILREPRDPVRRVEQGEEEEDVLHPYFWWTSSSVSGMSRPIRPRGSRHVPGITGAIPSLPDTRIS